MGSYKEEKVINAEFCWLFIILIQFVVILVCIAPIEIGGKLLLLVAFNFLIIFILGTQWAWIKRVIKMAE